MTLIRVEVVLIPLMLIITAMQLVLTWRLWRLGRQTARLNTILLRLAVQSFMDAHAPGFRIWEVVLGPLHVTARPAKDGQHSFGFVRDDP